MIAKSKVTGSRIYENVTKYLRETDRKFVYIIRDRQIISLSHAGLVVISFALQAYNSILRY